MADVRRFDPNQLRDPGGEGGGQWVSSPASAAKDALKLAGKIDLAPDEQLLASGKVDADSGSIRVAVIGAGLQRRVRIGIGGDSFGGRDDPAGPWIGSPPPSLHAANVVRKQNAAEQAALEAERPHADPARRDAIDGRLDKLYELGTSEITPGGYTADVAAADLSRLRVAVPEAIAKAQADVADEREWAAERDRIMSAMRRIRFQPGADGARPQRSPENQARWEALKAQLDELDANPVSVEMGHVYLEGRIPGEHATVHFRVEAEDTEDGVQVRLGAVPHDSEFKNLDDLDNEDLTAVLTPGELGKLVRILDQALPPVERSRMFGSTERKYNPLQKRDPDGEWGDGVPGLSKIVGRIPSDDGLDLELSSATGGGAVVRFPLPDDAGHLADRVTLPAASVARLKADLGDLDVTGKAHAAKLRKAIRQVDDTGEGTPEHAQALEAFWAVADRTIGGGSAPADGGASLHWELSAGEEDVTFSMAIRPADAAADWSLSTEATDGVGGHYPLSAVAKLRKQLDKLDENGDRGQSGHDETRAAIEHIFEDGICISCADDEPDGPMDEHAQALLAAITELGTEGRAFNPSAHPRNPKGSAGGGRFRSNVDKLKDALKAHKAGSSQGDPFADFDREQLRRVAKARGIELKRGEGRDSIAAKLKTHLEEGPAPAEPKPLAAPAPVKRAPAKKSAAKRAPAKTAGSADRSSGSDLIGSDPEALARRVAKEREHHVAADRSLSAIGHEQGFDGKPRVVSKAEMDKLVADGNAEVFRGVKGLGDGKTAAEIQQDMRAGHAWYGLGIYGNGYYWGGPDHAAKFADKTEGSTARAVLDPNAKVIEFWGELYPEHEKFIAQHQGTSGESHIAEVFSDPGRYAAARGYDVIKIVPNKGEPWYNVLNRTALIVEEA